LLNIRGENSHVQAGYQGQAPEKLDAATVRAVEEGLRLEGSGNFMTIAEAVQFAKPRRKAWNTAQRASA
jgi:hypothetical protein